MTPRLTHSRYKRYIKTLFIFLRDQPQGIWGMTHADVNKGGHTNDFKVVRMESVKEHEIGLPVFAGKYIGYFKLTTGFQTET